MTPEPETTPARTEMRPLAKKKAKPLPHPVRQLAPRDAPLVERLRKLCLAFPEAGERLSHGEPTWFAGKGKVFAMLDNHHHGASHLSVWLPQPADVQETLIDADAKRFFRPPYVGPSGWIGVVLDEKPDWRMIQHLVHAAFVHVATKKLVAQLDAPDPHTRSDHVGAALRRDLSGPAAPAGSPLAANGAQRRARRKGTAEALSGAARSAARIRPRG